MDEEGRALYRKRPYLVLTDLSAHIEHDTEATDWDSFNRRDFDQPARAALEGTLQQLRIMANWIEINTHLRWLEVKYRQPNGEPLPWKTPLYVSFEGGDLLDVDQWRAVATAVRSRQPIRLADELLLEAQRFLLQHNSRFALVSAAVACEVLVRERIVHALAATGGMTTGQADGFFQEVRNPQVTALLPCFYEVPDGLVEAVDRVFNQRNMILHGRQRRQPSREQARDAIGTARELALLGQPAARP